jgi:diketogulonate reductase-like aldo/keto reductase
VLYHLLERTVERSVIPWCEQHSAAVVAYSPFGHGRFPGLHTAARRVLAEIAAAHDATPRQVALAFLCAGLRYSPSPRLPPRRMSRKTPQLATCKTVHERLAIAATTTPPMPYRILKLAEARW